MQERYISKAEFATRLRDMLTIVEGYQEILQDGALRGPINFFSCTTGWCETATLGIGIQNSKPSFFLGGEFFNGNGGYVNSSLVVVNRLNLARQKIFGEGYNLTSEFLERLTLDFARECTKEVYRTRKERETSDIIARLSTR